MAYYNHPYWGKYAAITENSYGKGHAYYVGTYLNEHAITELYKYILKSANLWTSRQNTSFPIINKTLHNVNGEMLDFYFNYSNNSKKMIFNSSKGTSLFNKKQLSQGDDFELDPWDLQIFIVNTVQNASE